MLQAEIGMQPVSSHKIPTPEEDDSVTTVKVKLLVLILGTICGVESISSVPVLILEIRPFWAIFDEALWVISSMAGNFCGKCPTSLS